VDECLAAIRTCRPQGPYRLAGWSFGGVAAHAVATRLQQAGEKVEQFILFDSYPMPPDDAPDYPTEDSVWRDIALGADLILPESHAALDAAKIQAIAAQQRHLFAAFPPAQLSALGRIMANNSRLLPTARLGVFAGDLHLFYATLTTRDMDRSRVSPTQWYPCCTGTVHALPIDAEHHHMLSPKALAQIRGRLDDDVVGYNQAG
jgi:thioesterase domain-containing protein